MSPTVSVALARHGYAIEIDAGLLEQTGAHLRTALGRTCALGIVTDANVAPLYGETVERSVREAGFGPVCATTVPAGEASKCLARAGDIYNDWLAANLDRRAAVLALGGGVVGDLSGFAAATFLRGIAYVQLPTTLLAQVDSSVGGKTGVDLPQGKNLIGAFHQPALVLADTDTLRTLPRKDLTAGLAEVVKYGVIEDAELFAYLEENAAAILALDAGPMAHILRRSCEIKAQVVVDDERELSGRRAILNFGHTIGHAIEAEAGYGGLRHGEAVAVGMVAAGELALSLGRWTEAEHQRMVALLERFGLPSRAPGLDIEAVLARTAVDKKAVGGRARFVLPTRLGHVELVDTVPADAVRRAVSRRVE